MHVTATTLRGRGVEVVSRDSSISPDKLRLVQYRKGQVLVVDKGAARIDVDEIRIISEFLGKKGVKIDRSDRERQVAVTAVRNAIKEMANRGWLNPAGLAAAERLRHSIAPGRPSMLPQETVPVVG